MHAVASVALTTMGKEPFCNGVPDNTPAGESVMPLGSALIVLKLVVPMPPDCVNVSLKAALTTPELTAGAVTVIVWQTMVSV